MPREKLLLRRGEVLELLGVTDRILTRMVREGVIKPVQFPGCRAFYRRADILEAIDRHEQQTVNCYA
jgi:predicted site-specific integrase-resolvase